MTTYLWQQIPNQGFNLYGKGIVGPGSRETLDRAVNFHAGYDGTPVSNPTKIEVLKQEARFPNIWGGPDYQMKPGQLRMTYGVVDGKLDQAGSVDVKLMESTHREAIPIGNGKYKAGEYLTDRLRTPGTAINAIKDANIGVAVPTEEMTHILSSEAKAVGAAPTRLKPGMVIAHDALGVYAPPLKTVLKKNQPVDAAGKALHAKLSKFAKIQDLATTYAKEGYISAESSERFIGKAWKFVQKFAKLIKV